MTYMYDKSSYCSGKSPFKEIKPLSKSPPLLGANEGRSTLLSQGPWLDLPPLGCHGLPLIGSFLQPAIKYRWVSPLIIYNHTPSLASFFPPTHGWEASRSALATPTAPRHGWSKTVFIVNRHIMPLVLKGQTHCGLLQILNFVWAWEQYTCKLNNGKTFILFIWNYVLIINTLKYY